MTFAAELAEEASNEITGTLGDNGGFTWTYDPDTCTLRVTGEDTGIGCIFDSVEYAESAKEIVFENCVFSGSLAHLLDDGKSVDDDKLTYVGFDDCDTSGVTDMSCMFSNCNKLFKIDVSGFDTSNVTDMRGMFSNCR